MNFNFGFAPRKMGFQPSFRQFSSMGPMGLPNKIDNFTKIGHFNAFNGPIISDKSFSNPNFVNKHNPNILAPTLAGIVNFDTQNSCINQPRCDMKITKVEPEPEIIPNISSQDPKPVNMASEATQQTNNLKAKLSPKMNKRSKRKKRRNMKKKNVPDKTQSRSKKCSGRKRPKPWHKTNLDLEIMELSESTLDSDSSNMIEEPESPFCITITSKSTPIDIIPDSCLHIDKTDSPMSISPCHHELMRSLSITKESCSPCSPIVRRFKMPSECESEDSYIVFDDKASESEEISSYEDSDFEEESESDESDSDVEFIENCDISRKQKKVRVLFFLI